MKNLNWKIATAIICTVSIIFICLAGFDLSIHSTIDGQLYDYQYSFHPFDKFLDWRFK